MIYRLSVGFPNMSKSHKSLLKSNINLEINEFVSRGEMWYKNIRINLNQMLLQEYLQIYDIYNWY